ncbi:MAG: hypothetical protein COX57_01175 [Alphaproteobacteria bacterium CG_4_10_14_0_2_um_filter_63_37]|nr:MAG: hypothetical protein COX57_01175 [Alphaproteobacteria bacterium CG_4_10_14_0_2_um_filter_63_37]
MTISHSKDAPMLNLLLGIHCHQPLGNFPEVIEQIHDQSYAPFLEALARHPDIKMAVHLSGSLLDWMHIHHPETVLLLKALVERGQVELLGGGYHEPILASLPERDRVDQVRRLSDTLEQQLGQRPRATWLTERVWSPDLPVALDLAGIELAFVDDHHFLASGHEPDAVEGMFETESAGHPLKLLPISERLRYRIPFAPVADLMSELVGWAEEGRKLAVMVDDGEKFGAWPETHAWVYGSGWIDDLFTQLAAHPALTTILPSQALDTFPPRPTYLTTTSYREMGVWSLPPSGQETMADLEARLRETPEWPRYAPRIIGAPWHQMLVRYPEALWMHRRMLGLSGLLDDQPLDHPAREGLHRAQANDAYWHGVFGGLYLPHLRRQIYTSLLESENALDLPEGWSEEELPSIGTITRIRQGDFQMWLDEEGGIREWDFLPARVALSDLVARHKQPYHTPCAPHGHVADAEAPATIHNPRALPPEWREEALVHEEEPLRSGLWQGLSETPPWGIEGEPGCRYLVAGQEAWIWGLGAIACPEPVLCTWHLILPCCDGVAGRIELALPQGGEIVAGLGQAAAHTDCRQIRLFDTWSGIQLTLDLPEGCSVTYRPRHTVNLSEAGFERIFQGGDLTVAFPPKVVRAGQARQTWRGRYER